MKLAQTDLDSGIAVEGQAMSGLPSRLETLTKKQFITIPQAVAALANMERELDSAESYAQIRKLADAAEALKILFRHVAEVKNKAELVVLAANARIGEEIRAIPKASGRPAKIITAPGKNKDSRSATGIPGTSRSRLQKIAAIPKPELKAIAKKIQESGGVATMTAVLRELKETEIKDLDRCAALERETAAILAELAAFAACSSSQEWFNPASPQLGASLFNNFAH